VTVVVVEGARKALAHLAAAFHGSPAASLPVVGVTGTNGKTTTCALIEAAFTACGDAVGVVGTTGHRLAGSAFPFTTASGGSHTTPEAPHLQALLARMRDAGATAITMEASSIGLHAHRVDGIPFQVAVFTNLSRDHLDYHGDMTAYLRAKSRLFRELLAPGGTAILPLETDVASSLIPAGTRVLTTGLDGADISAQNVRITATGTVAELRTPVGAGTLELPLAGRHNLWNALGAVAAGIALGRPLEALLTGLAGLKGVDGRLESVANTLGITVLVDYAHTPDALEQVLKSLREVAAARILTVFGCGGDRDRGKRSEMGAAASAGSDIVFVTSDNPRTEAPRSIVDDILEGVTGESVVLIDRREAIASAIATASQGDIVLIAGKGHETYQEIDGRRLPFDDRAIARSALGVQV